MTQLIWVVVVVVGGMMIIAAVYSHAYQYVIKSDVLRLFLRQYLVISNQPILQVTLSAKLLQPPSRGR